VLAQIADDTKRLNWLGRALPLRFTGLDGVHVDVTGWKGRPVVVVFFATPSASSLKVFAQMRQVAEENGARFVGVSLDGDRTALTRFLTEQKGTVPVAWDGKGWDSPLVTALGLNAVPSVWLLDKKGVVRTLDPMDAPEELVRKLAK
jgi:peroxiredoxin